MRSSTADGVTDDDESVTISDESAATTETDDDVESKEDAVESPAASHSTPFHEGEIVLAYHKLLLYEAKVVQVDLRSKEFLIHYLGWSKSWDEWVSMDRLLKHNEENLQKQKKLEKECGSDKMTKRASLIKPKNPNAPRGKKRKNESKGTTSLEKLMDVQLPPILKKHLVNHCDYITHSGKLIKLPRSPHVDDILSMYLKDLVKKDGRVADSTAQILNGLCCYFDKALPVMLLYRSERQQYGEATANKISPSKIYGAEHLLRLFVKLPEILYHANIEEETLAELQHQLQDFLKYLQKYESTFFLSTYKEPEDFCKDTE